jgi:starch synthase
MTGLVPAYLKTVYKKEPVFSHSKIVFTIGQNTFKEKLGSGFLKKALIHPTIKDKDLEMFKETNNTALFRGGASYADAITFGAEKIEKKLVDEFTKVRGKKTLAYNPTSDLTDYLQLYSDLAGK